jgi:excisionase family DNA binding protein
MKTTELLNMEDLSALLGIPLGTIRNWRVSGYGPPGFKVGRHVRYRQADVEAWLASLQEV